MRSRLSTRSIGGLAGGDAAVEVPLCGSNCLSLFEVAVVVVLAEEKGPSEFPPVVRRRLINLEAFIIDDTLVGLSVAVLEALGTEAGGLVMRIRMVSPDVVV